MIHLRIGVFWGPFRWVMVNNHFLDHYFCYLGFDSFRPLNIFVVENICRMIGWAWKARTCTHPQTYKLLVVQNTRWTFFIVFWILLLKELCNIIRRKASERMERSIKYCIAVLWRNNETCYFLMLITLWHQQHENLSCFFGFNAV